MPNDHTTVRTVERRQHARGVASAWKTAITHIERNEILVRGYHVDAMMGRITFSEAISFQILCADQDEVDHYWTRLSEGGEEGPCGWLKDRFGLSWQVVPTRMYELLQDPDADRLAIVDNLGRYIGEELTLALCADWVLSQRTGPVVVNGSTSRAAADIAAKYGCPFHRSYVGEAHVVAKMQEVGAVLGGEGNGGVIEPKVGYVRDSFVAMAYVLAGMAARKAARQSSSTAWRWP